MLTTKFIFEKEQILLAASQIKLPATYMYAVIDIETTGGNYRWGRITEVAIFIHNGTEVVQEYSTLVNPEMPIPSFITNLTGISNEMVANAPTFGEVANIIKELTEGHIFVAHNSQFDYSFIKHEFHRLGISFERSTLCTVRASRKLIPNHASYSLGTLCEQLNIQLENRHRAGGDAAATVKLLELLLSIDTDHTLASLIAEKQAESPFNKYLSNSSTKLEDLPQSPGIIYFTGPDDALLYIDNARNIRKRVLAHLKNKGGRSTVNMRDQLMDVDYEETGTFLIAQLRAKEEILKLKPKLNPAPKSVNPPKRWYIVPDVQLDGYVRLKLERITQNGMSGSFRSKKEAMEAIEKLIAANDLCVSFTPLASSVPNRKGNVCLNGHKMYCKGACKEEEKPEVYNKRIDAALQSLEENKNKLIIEKGRNPLEKSLIKIENSYHVSWGYLNVEERPMDLQQLLECSTTICKSPEATDIAQNYLLKNNVQRIFSF